MANEFFTCPTYSWGIFILSIILVITSGILFQVSPGLTAILNGIGSILAFGWLVFNVYRTIWRNPKCERVGFGSKYGNLPFSSGPSEEDQKRRMDAISALEQ